MPRLLIHGIGQSAKSWDAVISNIEESYCPNLLQLIKDESVDYKTLYACFVAYCEAIPKPIDMCGLSLGGVLALNYTLDYPKHVNSLVLIGSQYKMPRRLLKLQNTIFKLLPSRLFQQEDFTKNDFIKLSQSMMNLDFSQKVCDIKCKTLVRCGKKDWANKQSSQKLAEKIRNAKYIAIENSGHVVNEDNPERLSQVLLEFWNDID